MSTNIWPLEITPPIDHDIVRKLCVKLGAQSSPVRVKRSSKLRPVSNCYWNVDAAVKESGGKSVNGWALMWWPDLYGTALHHAVWQRPNGDLLDITEPQPPDSSSRHTLFLPDDRYEVDLRVSPTIDNVIVAISSTPTLQQYISTYLSKQETYRQIAKIYWQIGYRNEHLFAKAAGLKPSGGMEIPAEIEKHYDTLLASYDAASSRMGKLINDLSLIAPA